MHKTVSKVLKRSVFPILHFGRLINGGAIAPPPPPPPAPPGYATGLSVVIGYNNGIGCVKVHDHWKANFRQKGNGLLALLANLPHLPLYTVLKLQNFAWGDAFSALTEPQ